MRGVPEKEPRRNLLSLLSPGLVKPASHLRSRFLFCQSQQPFWVISYILFNPFPLRDCSILCGISHGSANSLLEQLICSLHCHTRSQISFSLALLHSLHLYLEDAKGAILVLGNCCNLGPKGSVHRFIGHQAVLEYSRHLRTVFLHREQRV